MRHIFRIAENLNLRVVILTEYTIYKKILSSQKRDIRRIYDNCLILDSDVFDSDAKVAEIEENIKYLY